METIIGVILDVSGSMKRHVDGKYDKKNEKWARSIFRVIDDLIKHDVSSTNECFAFGIGADKEPVAFDLLNTIKHFQPEQFLTGTREVIIGQIIDILEENGASRIRRWAKMAVLLKNIDETFAKIILTKLIKDANFRFQFVYNCLPESCRTLEHGFKSYATEAFFSASWLVEGGQEYASESSVKEVVLKARQLLVTTSFAPMSPFSSMGVHAASDILHDINNKKELTDERVDELMEIIEPYIYGGTPLIQAVNESMKLFCGRKYKNYRKMLFILSDGEPSDGFNYDLLCDTVNIVCCYITDQHIENPKRLYTTESLEWTNGAKFMFQISSTITSQNIPRTLFVKRGWDIDISNNETHLFAQVNHPDIIKDVCDFALDIVCNHDTLSDVLSSVSLDLYINDKNNKIKPKHQGNDDTCYAHASAVVLHLAMIRIIGRHGGYPTFGEIYDEVVAKYGKAGANSVRVLRETCPKYRLKCKEVTEKEALEAIVAKRPVLAKFRLTAAEWDIFEKLFYAREQQIMTINEINIRCRTDSTTYGHAVVLTSFDSNSLRLMNSWGTYGGDGGFFRIKSADVLGLSFVDVFWDEDDLLPEEKDAYRQDGARIARDLFSTYKGLQKTVYECPNCHITSNVNEYTGHHLKAKCPRCGSTFNVNKIGDALALNLYLLSLCHTNPKK